MTRLLLAAAILALSTLPVPAAANNAGEPIALRSNVTVAGEVVRLGDIFTGLSAELAETPLARSPAPGRAVEVGPRWLGKVARQFKVAWQPRTQFDRITVERDSLVISTTEIEDTFRSRILEEGLTGKVSLIFDGAVEPVHLSADSEPVLEVASFSFDHKTGRFRGRLALPSARQPEHTISLSGRALELIEVPVLNRGMGRDEVITPADLAWQSVRADRLPHNAVRDIKAIIGQSPDRPLRAGTMLRDNDLSAPLVVARNELVTLRLQTPFMVLSVQGRALEDGADGQSIRVLNTASKRVVSGVVASPGLVVTQ